MVVIDEALAQRARAGRPIRLSVVGFGFMGRAIARQIALATPGTELASSSAATSRVPGPPRATRDSIRPCALLMPLLQSPTLPWTLFSKPPAAWITEPKSCCAPSNNASTSSS